MKKIISMITSLVILLTSSMPVFADRNEDRAKESKTAELQTAATRNLSAKLSKMLDGCIVVKAGKSYVYESGKAVDTDAPAYYKDGGLYIPVSAAAGFFGQKAEWNSENGSVTIGGKLIYPGDGCEIKASRTMAKAEKAAELLGVKLLYSDENTAILGKKELSKSELDSVVSALSDVIYVTSDTSKNGDGTFENPYGGIEYAVRKIREKTSGGMNTDLTVYLRGGLYTQRHALEFTPEDSGKNGFTITYKSYPGETAEIAAAETVKGWKLYRDGIYMAKVDAQTPVNLIFENDLLAHKARYPNIDNRDFKDCYLKSAGYDKENTLRFFFEKGDIPYLKDTSGLQVYMWGGGENGVWNWYSERRNAVINYRERSLTVSHSETYVMGKGSRYYIEGCLELLDEEGEFYYDEINRTIYYKPYNEDINSQVITYGTAISPIRLIGTKDNPVKNIGFEDLKIGKSNTNTELRAAIHEAIYFLYADNCGFKNSEILMTGGDALQFENCKNCYIIGNWIHDVGAAAVRLTAEDLAGDPVYRGNRIENNYIYNCGLIKRDANGIHLKNTDYGTVLHNRVDEVPRADILWGSGYTANMRIGQSHRGQVVTEENQYDFSNCMHNYIAYNDTSHALTDSQDGGAMYGWGSGKGNLVENNHIHDMDIPFSMGYAMYGDNQTGYTTWQNNLIDNNNLNGAGTIYAAMVIKGVQHQVYNNFFLNNPRCTRGAFATSSNEDDNADRNIYMRNLTVNSSDQLHGQHKWLDNRFRKVDYNMYYNDSGKYLVYNNPKAKTYEEWKKIETDYGLMDAHSLSGQQPKFVDYENRDYRLRYDSPAFSVGIRDIDERDIGLTADFKFADREEELYKLYPETESDGLSANVRLNSGESTRIKLTARTVSGFFANLDNAEIKYASSNPSVAAVGNDGVIKAGTAGIAEITITAEKNGKTVKSNLFVLVNDRLDSIEANAADSVIDNNSETSVLGIAKSTMGYYLPVSDFTYKSSNEKILTVDKQGNIESHSPGTAYITVTGSYKGITKSASAAVTVLDGVLDSITLSGEKTDGIVVGENVKFDYSVLLTTGKEVAKSDVHAVYSTDDESVAVIDQNGNLSAVSEGETNVNITLEKDGFRKSASKAISVYKSYSGTLAQGWKETNFGTSHGYADFRSDGTVLMRSTGVDFFGTADDGYYLYKDIKGENVSVEMNIQSILQRSNNTAVGVTVRESASPDARNYTVRLQGSSVLAVWRDETGGECKYASLASGTAPIKIKVEKKGSQFNAYVDSGDGWKLLHSTDMTFMSCTAGVPMYSQHDLSTQAIVKDLTISE